MQVTYVFTPLFRLSNAPLKDLVAHKGVDAAFFAIFILLLSGRPSIPETTSI